MAEFADLNLEQRVQEIEELRRLKLFTDEEIRQIVQSRKKHEYKIQRIMKKKEDFTSYINYESNLLKLIRLRRNKFMIAERKAKIEYAQMKKIKQLYKIVTHRYKADVELWVDYIKFCLRAKFYSVIPSVLNSMLKLHADKPWLWLMASKWEYEATRNAQRSMDFLARGLQFHPKDQELYREAFSLQLRAAVDLEEDSADAENADKLFLAKAKVVYMSATKEISDPAFFVSLLNILDQYSSWDDLKDVITNHLKTDFPKEELVWNALALRSSEKIGAFKEALSLLNTEKMWSYYLDYLSSNPEHATNMKKLVEELPEAYQRQCLSEKYFMLWTDILTSAKAEAAEEVLQMATQHHPLSTDLWRRRIAHSVEKKDLNEVVGIFKQSLAVFDDALLWNEIRETMPMDLKTMRCFHLEALNFWPKKSAVQVAVDYLLSSYKAKGLQAARRIFEMLCRKSAQDEVLSAMLSIEEGLEEVSVKNIRRIHDIRCNSFGKYDPDVWLESIHFEKSEGDAFLVCGLYEKAIRNLIPDKAEEFESRYAVRQVCSESSVL